MLISDNLCSKNKKRPHFAAWFGNFFEPYFSDKEKVEQGIKELRELGFNTVVLDSRLWSDFTEYFKTKKESPYVSMQNYIARLCENEGLGLSFLALFANGDNLWPTIYDNPPEYIEQPVDYTGSKYRGYRHWSEKQLEAHISHCINLYDTIAKNCAASATDDNGKKRLPFYFYHSPIFAPCFDDDGIKNYLSWLSSEYTIDEINSRYNTAFSSFDQMTPPDYWTYPGSELAGTPTPEDYKNLSPVLYKYADNQRYKQHIMSEYFKKLTGRLKEIKPGFYFYAGLSQWKLFFSDFVHIQNRGWDLWDLGKHLDSPTFLTMPIDMEGTAEAYVVPCELAMLRSASSFPDFVAGLFVGRYCTSDVYGVCSPAEVLASALGSGATDLYFYGYNGLDDGGNFGKWDKPQKDSLKNGLDWFSEVRKVSGRRKASNTAILYPYASYTLVSRDGNPQMYKGFRYDLLGWYQQFADHGINPDIIHPSQVSNELLAKYKYIILPADPYYSIMPDAELERCLSEYIASGGTILHSQSPLAERILDLKASSHTPDSFAWEETITTDSAVFVSYDGGTSLARYLSDGKCAVRYCEKGNGRAYSFGFWYGEAYHSKEHLPVPRQYGKQNHYPLTVIEQTPVDKLLKEDKTSYGRKRGIEQIPFENGTLRINHTPYTFAVPDGKNFCISSFEGFDGKHLPGHHAVFTKN